VIQRLGRARLSAGPSLLSVPVRPGPDEREAFLAFDLDQGCVDRGREARVGSSSLTER
jgi:hypothetical protein